jgi:hypothetical protein
LERKKSNPNPTFFSQKMERQMIMEMMIIELLNEIKDLKIQINNRDEWQKLQYQNYKDENDRLIQEIRTLLIQTNILVERLKRQDKEISKRKLINKHF